MNYFAKRDDRPRLEAVDRRKTERHVVPGTVSFSFKDAIGKGQEHWGNIRNVSAGGLFIEAINPPPVGSETLIEIYFLGKNRTASIRTRGQVKRVEVSPLNGQEAGFAVHVRRMNLHRISDAAVEEG